MSNIDNWPIGKLADQPIKYPIRKTRSLSSRVVGARSKASNWPDDISSANWPIGKLADQPMKYTHP